MKNIRSRSIYCFGLFLMIVLFQSYSAKGQFIDFENLAAPPNGTGGLKIGNNFPDLTFNFPTALDFAASPGFAHSGTKAIEICHGIEFCGGQLEITFNELQHHVKIW